MTGARRVIVSGGSGALGRAVVEALLAQGTRVAVPYRASSPWEALKTSVTVPEALWGAPADVADSQAARRFVDEAAAWLGSLDGVAALAGAYAGSGPLDQAPDEEWPRMMAANLGTAYALCRAALPHLLRGGGSVVTVSSRLAESGAGAAAYAVSKAAVLALTRALALENRERGVRFNCVVPGIIDTPANRRAMPQAEFSGWAPPQAIARVVVFLLSPESAPLSGAVLPVDALPLRPKETP